MNQLYAQLLDYCLLSCVIPACSAPGVLSAGLQDSCLLSHGCQACLCVLLNRVVLTHNLQVRFLSSWIANKMISACLGSHHWVVGVFFPLQWGPFQPPTSTLQGEMELLLLQPPTSAHYPLLPVGRWVILCYFWVAVHHCEINYFTISLFISIPYV